jgi:hypothetical protein
MRCWRRLGVRAAGVGVRSGSDVLGFLGLRGGQVGLWAVGCRAMPVEFLSDDQASAYGRYNGPPGRVQLERFFFLDDVDKALVCRRRGDHNRLGFAVQLATVRYLGMFLADPVDVPSEVVDYLADQSAIADPSCVRGYSQRETTHREHAGEIQREYGLRDFGEVAEELAAWVDARDWTTGEGPEGELRRRGGVASGAAGAVAGCEHAGSVVVRVQAEATHRLWRTLYDLAGDEQRRLLDGALEVLGGERTSLFDQLRMGPAGKPYGPAMVKALNRISKISALGVAGLDLSPIPALRTRSPSTSGVDGVAWPGTWSGVRRASRVIARGFRASGGRQRWSGRARRLALSSVDGPVRRDNGQDPGRPPSSQDRRTP